jgi:hypothetical protein
MTITAAQAWTSTGSNITPTSLSFAYTNVPAAGNLLVCVFVFDSALTLSSITDNIGDGVAWSLAIGPIVDNNNGSKNYVYYKVVGTPSGGLKTVTVTASAASSAINIALVEYHSSVAGTWATDGTASVVNTVSTNPSPGAITTTSADGIVVGEVTKSGATPTAGTGFTIETTFTAYFGYQAIEDKITTASGSYTASWADAASSTWTALAAAFKFTASASVFLAGAPFIKRQAVNRASTY